MAKPATDHTALLREHEDKKIEHNINRKLTAVKNGDTSDMQIKVHEGAVLLTGTVADTRSLEQAVLVIFTVKGVKRIDNKIKIRKEGIASMVSHIAANIESFTDDKKGKNKQD